MTSIVRMMTILSIASLFAASSAFADGNFDNMIASGKYKEAIQYAEKQMPASGRTVAQWLALALAHKNSGSPRERVLVCLNEAQRVNPSDPQVLGQLGEYYYQMKNYAEAIKFFQSSFLLKRSGLMAEKMALCAFKLKQLEKAKDAAESAVQLDSTLFECRPILIQQYLQEKNWSAAAEQLAFIAKKGKATLVQWKQLAMCYEKAGMTSKLVFADSTIVALDSKNIPSRVRYAAHVLSKGDTATAVRLYKELAILNPKDQKSFKYLYELSLARNNKNDAILYLKNFLVLDTSESELYWLLGDLLNEKKDQAGALEAYRQAFKSEPKKGKGHLKTFAYIVLNNKLEAEAVPVITAAISAGEADVKLYMALGDIYRNRKKYADAVKMYQEALKIDPKSLTVMNAMADCQAKSGDVKNAILSYEQIVLMNPKPSQEYKALGDLQMKIGKKQNAIASYEKYLETTPNDYKVARTVGLYYYDEKKFKEAVKYLNMVKDPSLQNVTLLSALGLSAFNLNDCNTATGALAKAWAAKPKPSILVKILNPLADCYERNGNTPKAAEAYEAYASLPGVKNADVAYRGAFLKERSNRSGAITAYMLNTKKYPKDYRNFLRLGLLFAADSTALDKAAANLSAASALTDTVKVLWRTLAKVYGKLKKPDKELSAWTKLITLEPQDAEANRRIGAIMVQQKEYSKAIAPLEVVSATTDPDYDLLQLLAKCYLETKRPKEALNLLRKAKLLKPEDAEIRVAIINAATKVTPAEPVDTERKELAEIDKRIISKDKKNVESRIRLVEYYHAKNDLKNTYALLKELAVLTPKDPVVFKKLFEIASQNKQKKEAAGYLREYIAINPENANAYKNLGDLLFELKDLDGALKAYRTTVKLDPKLKGFYKNYISIVLQKKMEADAIQIIETAIKFNEADTKDYLALGDIYRKKGQCKNAISMYTHVLKRDPKNINAMSHLAECQGITGDVKNAIISYEQVVLMKPKASKEYKMLGDLQLKAGKTEAAMEAYHKYLALVPADQAVARTVGLYEYQQKKYQEAIKNLELVKDPSLHNVEYLVALGNCYYAVKNTKKTIEILAKAWAAKPKPPTLEKVLRILAECYMKTKQEAKALSAYDALVKLPGVKDPDAAYLRGSLREKSDRASAIKIYSANTKAFPKDYRNFMRLGMILASDPKSQSSAAKVLERTTSLVDSIPLLWETLSSVHRKIKNETGELQALQKLLKLQPQNLEANKRVSELLFKRKQVAQAITNLEMVLTMAPTDVATMVLLADGYIETKRPEQALALLEKAVGIDKKNIEIKSKLYELCRNTGQPKKAETEIKALISLTKDNKYRFMYAQDLVTQNRYDEAMKIITDIKSSDPMNIDALMLRGTIQKAQKKYDEAIETYKEISYINEKHVPSLIERGDTYLLQNEYKRAEHYFQKALTVEPKNGMAVFGLALVAKAKKNMKEYKELLNKAKALDPKNTRIQMEAVKSEK